MTFLNAQITQIRCFQRQNDHFFISQVTVTELAYELHRIIPHHFLVLIRQKPDF